MFYNAPFNASDTRKYIFSCNEYNVFTKSLNVLLHSLNNNFSFIFFFYVRAYHHRHRHHHHLFTASIHPPLVSCNPSCISSCTVLPFSSKFTNYKKSSHQNEWKLTNCGKSKWLSSYIYKLQYSHIFRRTHNLTKQIWNEIWTFCKTNVLHFWFQTYLFNISCFFLHLIYDEILCGNVFIHMW